ncbi:hypothetical protein H8A99_22395 [Bradyrhizobium sp. Arg68]|uniref:hypothetical protein n=1 Tax=Bradyrhizobium ivorense TaxID=2511166 RepID=UPI001E3E64AB|nr:hypothetical protein [Bradyrhizobium ivorense]MCC8939148.1 hypothetical protein [Bradyrhizobium ivorense]
MKRTPRLLLAVSLLGLSALASSGSALADGDGAPFAPRFPWGFGYGSPPTYDGYLFSNGYPVYTGRDVTAIAVDLVNARFRHRRVVGPGVIYSQPNPYWW